MFRDFADSAFKYSTEVLPKAMKDRIFLSILVVVGFWIAASIGAHLYYNELFQKVVGYEFLGHAFPQTFFSTVKFSFFAPPFLRFLLLVLSIMGGKMFCESVQAKIDTSPKQSKRRVLTLITFALSLLLIPIVATVFMAWFYTRSFAEGAIACFSVLLATNLVGTAANNLLITMTNLFSRENIGEAILRLAFGVICVAIVGLCAWASLSVDSRQRKDTIDNICSKIKLVSIQSNSGVNYTGWLLGEIAGKTFIREKIDFGIYQTIAMQNTAIATISDFSEISFAQERKKAFSLCE